MPKVSPILDHRGEPIVRKRSRPLRARFDLAQTTRDNEKHWAMADGRSARTSLAPDVRRRMRQRSRYEAENSSWYSGILSTATNHVIGTGPRLQMLTADPLANQKVERFWLKWSRSIGLTSKLRVMFETYWRDGECFGLRHSRPTAYPVAVDLKVYEAEQVQNPVYNYAVAEPHVDDGIRFVTADEPVEYFFLDHHPSDPYYTAPWTGEWRPAADVIHLYRPNRPGQLRGIPRAASGLPLLAVMRRFEIATVHAAETAANQPMVLHTTASANVAPAQSPQDFATIELDRNSATIVPEGWTLTQAKPEHPATTMEMFIRQLLMHFCRSMNVPYGLAAGTSKDSNFSSHKGDVRNLWEPEVVVEQSLIESLVLEKLFAWFLEDAMFAGILDGMPRFEDMDHQWFWDGIPPLDETDAANAAAARVSTGQSTHILEYARSGHDFESSMAKADSAYGLPPGTYKSMVLQATFPSYQPGGALPANVEASAPGGKPSGGAGEYTELGQRAYNNVQRRIDLTISQLQAGEIDEGMARIRLETNGLDPARIDRVIELAIASAAPTEGVVP